MSLEMKLNTVFIENIKTVYREEGRVWLGHLDSLVADLSREWNFRLIAPVAELSYNFVADVESLSDGRTMILKMGPPSSTVSGEVRWLESYSGVTPEIFHRDEKRSAFLMEKCVPGFPLKEWVKQGRDEEATRVVASMIRSLRKQNVKSGSFKHLSELIPDLDALDGIADAKLLSQAKSLFTEMTIDRSQDILLHGDLHHDNILSQGSAWKVIDPHGYVGDPVSEVGVMIYNPLDAFPQERPLKEVLERRLAILSEETGDHPQHIRNWCFCKTMLSAAWNIQDFGEQAKTDLGIATLLS